MNRAAARSKSPADRRKIVLYATLAVVVIAIVVGVGLASRVPKAASVANMHSKLKPATPRRRSPSRRTRATSTWRRSRRRCCSRCSPPGARTASARRPSSTTWPPSTPARSRSSRSAAARRAMDSNSPESQADVNQFGAQFNVKYPLAFDPELKVGSALPAGRFPDHRADRQEQEGQLHQVRRGPRDRPHQGDRQDHLVASRFALRASAGGFIVLSRHSWERARRYGHALIRPFPRRGRARRRVRPPRGRVRADRSRTAGQPRARHAPPPRPRRRLHARHAHARPERRAEAADPDRHAAVAPSQPERRTRPPARPTARSCARRSTAS